MNLNLYLTHLPSSELVVFVENPYFCLAIFNGLKKFGRLLLTRLISSPCHKNHFCCNDLNEVSCIFKLNLVLEKQDGLLVLSEPFRSNLFSALQGCLGTSKTPRIPDCEISYEDLWSEIQRRWERMMRLLLNNIFSDSPKAIVKDDSDKSILTIFKYANFFNEQDFPESSYSSRVTNSYDYSFLLSDTKRQTWIILKTWLEKICEKERIGEAFCFLIYISTVLNPGQIYQTCKLKKDEKKWLKIWAIFGLVINIDSDFRPVTTKSNKYNNFPYFTITPLLKQIIDPENHKEDSLSRWNGGIVVETNFYIYCYTDSDIIISLLKLFSQIIYKLPNLCVAKLTRKSVRRAFYKNLTSQNLIDFLKSNKHPIQSKAPKSDSIRDKNAKKLNLHKDDDIFPVNPESAIPEQVETQLKLWEEERIRFEVFDSMYWQFESSIDDPSWYHILKQNAIDLDALLWHQDEEMSFCIKKTYQDQMVHLYRDLQNRATNCDIGNE